VNKWWFLARSRHRAGATSLATHGDRTALATDPRSPMGSATSCVGRPSPATPGAPPPSRQRLALVHRRRRAVLISPAAEHWIAQLVEEPPPGTPSQSRMDPSNPHHRCREHVLCCTVSVGRALASLGPVERRAPCSSTSRASSTH
jgi:hypothetical protein